ncbi:MAG: DHH family phosphoesterase [Rivularia sp. (in: cyanobacteria)]
MLDEIKPKSQRDRRLPLQRWQIYPQKTDLAQKLARVNNMSPLINQLLINRGFDLPDTAEIFLNPQSLSLPEPLDEFPDLAMSVELLQNAIATQEKIAICGDYDADGMTSTALLLRSLRTFGADVDYAIPSRMDEGYGINKRIVEEFYNEGVGIILTVDNGISAFEPIARAKELGLKTIITDHHDIPQKLPPADAILNPKLLPESSVYRGVAGVGAAYILAMSLAEKLGRAEEISDTMLELFALGTIADLAPLVGVNRTWVKRGLRLLPKSQLAGIQALIQMAGVQALGSQAVGNNFLNPKSKIQNPSWKVLGEENLHPKLSAKSLKPDDIGFRLGPRINAIGRIGDPQIVIELLTTDDVGIALERAMQCEATNARRREMCEEIEKQAIALVETLGVASLKDDRVLFIVQPDWHHGVIGIVASRLLERYGVPVFIGTYEDDNHIRGSARGIPEFNVFDALQSCDDLLGKYGGHKAAGGFSLPAENLEPVRQRLSEFACSCLELQHLKPLLKIDTLANLNQVNRELYQQINALEPCGIENPNPVFWTPNVKVLEQKIVGKGHIKFTVGQMLNGQQYKIKGIAWRWRDYFPLPTRVDIAYKLKENNFNGNTSIELEVIGARLPTDSHFFFTYDDKPVRATFEYGDRQYICGIYQNGSSAELRIKSPQNKVLAVQSGHDIGLLGINREQAQKVDISQSPYCDIIKLALKALE